MDSPRSWAVAAACCWMNVFGFGLVRSAGVVYVGILETFSVSREQASWPVNLSIVCYMTAGPFVGLLARHIAAWKLTMGGCIVGSLAVAACFLVNSVAYLNVLLGVIHGTSISFLLVFVVVINQHFLKYRAMASGISHAGFSLGAIIFSPLTHVLFNEYGLRGSLLLCGAIMLNSTVGVFLQRPPPASKLKLAQKRHRLEQTIESNPPKQNIIKVPASFVTCEPQEIGKEGLVNQKIDVKKHDDAGIDHSVTKTMLGGNEAETGRDTGQQEKSENKHQHFHPHDLASKQKAEATNLEPTKGQCSSGSVLSFFTFPSFYLIAASQVLVFFIMGTYTTIIVDFSVDNGISRWYAISLVSLYNATDMIARFGSGLITDRGFLNKNTMMALHFALWSVSLVVTPFCTAYYCQVVLALVGGWCNGCTMILIVVFFVELVGIDNLGVTFGVGIFFSGACGFLRPSLIGYFRDHHGDYEGLFDVLAAFAAAILYVGILDTFHVTREEASWPISVTGSVYFMTALVGGILARYIKIWKLTLAGCLICSSAVSVCYFATSIWYLAVFLGFIHGAGVGLLALTTVVINQHFVKYRAVASGLNMAGFSIGGLLFPPLTQFFLAEYAAIIYTALLNSLNITREEASWPVTLMGIFLCVGGPVAGTLGRRHGIWKLTVPACLVGGLAVSVCFFANGIWFLVVFLGVIYGIAISFITLSTAVIRQHFTQTTSRHNTRATTL
ncbi:monocarboxylate transporter 7 [Ixodes scapularis]